MRIELTDEQADELARLIEQTVGDLSPEIAATDNPAFRARLMGRRRLLQEAGDALAPGGSAAAPAGGLRPDEARVWTVELVFTEDEDRTRVDARMQAARHDWHGWGRARRNPIDPDVPVIGEELAAARALSDLVHQLVDAAAHGIESFEHQPVRLHV